MYLTPKTKQEMIDATKEYLKILESMPAVMHCKSCFNFNNGNCDHFEAKPPEDFYDKDCEFFEELIPF